MSLSGKLDLWSLKNQMEEFVFIEMEKQLAELADEHINTCNDCILDIACFALNSLSPCYRSSLVGSLFTQDKGDEVHNNVCSCVTEAIVKVRENPLCGKPINASEP